MTGLAERLRAVADLVLEVPPATPDADLRVTAYENLQTIELVGDPALIAALAEHLGAEREDIGGRSWTSALDGCPVRLTQHAPAARDFRTCPCGGRHSAPVASRTTGGIVGGDSWDEWCEPAGRYEAYAMHFDFTASSRDRAFATWLAIMQDSWTRNVFPAGARRRPVELPLKDICVVTLADDWSVDVGP